MHVDQIHHSSFTREKESCKSVVTSSNWSCQDLPTVSNWEYEHCAVAMASKIGPGASDGNRLQEKKISTYFNMSNSDAAVCYRVCNSQGRAQRLFVHVERFHSRFHFRLLVILIWKPRRARQKKSWSIPYGPQTQKWWNLSTNTGG